MTDYSPRSRELAKELREKAIANLEKAGYTVRKSSTGRFVTSRGAAGGSKTTIHESRDGQSGRIAS